MLETSVHCIYHKALVCGQNCYKYCFDCPTDETPPTIEACPQSETVYVDTENMNVEKTVVGGNATAAMGKTVQSNTVTPSTYTLSTATVNDVITFKQEVVDDQGFTAECSFQYLIKRKFYY